MNELHASVLLAVVVTVCVMVSLFLFLYLRSDPSTQELDADLSAIQAQLAETEAEAAKYDGGLLLAFIKLRREILKTSQAMLEQKRSSVLRRVDLTYTVASTPEAPASPEQLSAISADIGKAQAQLEAAKAEAEQYSRGLVQAMALMTVATHRLTLAQLNLSYYGAKYGLKVPAPKLPPTQERLNGLGAIVGEKAAHSNEVTKSSAANIDQALEQKTKEEAQLEALRTAWSVQSDVSPLDKSPRVILTRLSDNSADDPRSAGVLGLRCIEGHTSVVIAQSDFLGISERVVVNYRIGTLVSVAHWTD